MVLLTTTPQILSAISSLPPSSLSTLSTLGTPLPTFPGAPISHTTLIALSRLLKASFPSKYTLDTLLRNARPYTPPPPPPPAKSPQYLALMARLRADQEAREYRSLTSHSQHQPTQIGVEAPLNEEKDDITPSLVVNILVSILCVGASSWYMTRWWRNDGVRVLVALLVAVVVGVAEVTVYAGYLRKVRLSRDKERRLRERRTVVSTEELGAGKRAELLGKKEEGAEEKESEEIWGRGKHGGMRRRARDKWEKDHGDAHEEQSLRSN